MAHGKTLELRKLKGVGALRPIRKGEKIYLPCDGMYTVYLDQGRGWRKEGLARRAPSDVVSSKARVK